MTTLNDNWNITLNLFYVAFKLNFRKEKKRNKNTQKSQAEASSPTKRRPNMYRPARPGPFIGSLFVFLKGKQYIIYQPRFRLVKILLLVLSFFLKKKNLFLYLIMVISLDMKIDPVKDRVLDYTGWPESTYNFF